MVGSGVKLFVQLNRIFGLAPFDMSLAVMAPKVVSQTSSITLRLHQMIPSYTALSFYSLCLASIFWQQRSGSQISATANWLQFIPNAFSYIVCLYAGIKNRALSEKILSTFHACDQKMQDSLGVSFRTYNSRANYLSYVASGGEWKNKSEKEWKYYHDEMSSFSGHFYWTGGVWPVLHELCRLGGYLVNSLLDCLLSAQGEQLPGTLIHHPQLNHVSP